jgi:hypothetical protein
MQVQPLEVIMNTLLKYGLLGNAIFSCLTGIALIIAPVQIAIYMGIPDPTLLMGVGIGLLPFAGHLIIALRRKPIRTGEVYYLSAMDGLWVLGSAAILLFDLVPFTTIGLIAFSLVALTVADFMFMQIIGIRKWVNAQL